MKKVFIAGAGGFIGGYLVKHFLDAGHIVVAADIKSAENWYQHFDNAENHVVNLEEKKPCFDLSKGCDEIYNLACNMGGMGFIENNRALCMLSVLINTHLLMAAKGNKIKKYFYSSSACVYKADRQTSPDVVALKEEDAYPAMPEDGYGWEKLFSERMCQHFFEDFSLDVRVARFHNVYGPKGTYTGGREKAPAAICRKVIAAKKSGNHDIEIWGDGKQTRSFMYIEDCITGITKLMNSKMRDPINLGSSELVTIDELTKIVEDIAGIQLNRQYNLDAPQGVRGRNSDNTLINKVLGWEPAVSLRDGMKKTYDWIEQQMG